MKFGHATDSDSSLCLSHVVIFSGEKINCYREQPRDISGRGNHLPAKLGNIILIIVLLWWYNKFSLPWHGDAIPCCMQGYYIICSEVIRTKPRSQAFPPSSFWSLAASENWKLGRPWNETNRTRVVYPLLLCYNWYLGKCYSKCCLVRNPLLQFHGLGKHFWYNNYWIENMPYCKSHT